MMRKSFLALLFLTVLLTAAPVYAQDEAVCPTPVCSPACSAGDFCSVGPAPACVAQCVSAGTGEGTGNAVVSEVVVTPPSSSGTTFATIVGNIVSIVSGGLIPVLYALAFLYFVYGLTRFVFADGEENRTKGKNIMIYGLIGLVVIFGVWGFVGIMLTTLNSLSGA